MGQKNSPVLYDPLPHHARSESLIRKPTAQFQDNLVPKVFDFFLHIPLCYFVSMTLPFLDHFFTIASSEACQGSLCTYTIECLWPRVFFRYEQSVSLYIAELDFRAGFCLGTFKPSVV